MVTIETPLKSSKTVLIAKNSLKKYKPTKGVLKNDYYQKLGILSDL